MNKEYLLRELQTGKSVDDLAKELTEALNAANQEYTASNSKITDGNELADMINYYIATYYNNFEKSSKIVSRKDIEEICDLVVEWAGYFDKLFPSKSKGKTSSDDEKIRSFLRSLS